MDQTEYKGYNGTLVLTDTMAIIKRGAKGFLLGGGMLRGDKSIPYSSIAAVQLKKAGFTAGYIQLTLVGGPEAKGGLFQSAMDENTINFQSWGDNNARFQEAKELIEQRIISSRSGVVQQRSDADELAKFAELKTKGIITEEEFQKKKQQLLGL